MYYFPQTYTIDDVVTNTHAALTRNIQASTMLPTQYAESFVTKLLCREEIYNDHVQEGVFIDRLHESSRQSMQFYCITHVSACQRKLA